ncbi:MAG: protein kinase [Bradymonadaceae bacterium]|nr:protein kinase [Lujinxingiaceae bacterium]
MAEIFRAKTFGAAGFEKEFAIKLILPSLVNDVEFVDMFINEAKIAVSLYHTNVVQVFDLGEMDHQYYIAMEFVHGKDLLDVLARCAEMNIKIPLNLVLFVAMEMLKGLDFAHRAKDPYGDDLKIIHRDVSPSNILISYAGDVKVGDFGVAKAAIQRNMTESGTLKGKVGYMSPEQVMGEDIDSRSDIFSACIVFFEALSMSRLFVGGSDLDVMLRVRDADISTSMAKAEPLPSTLKSIIYRGLARHREERYQTAGEFYQALVDFCFQHGVKVNGSDLSSFMRRLFADEIEHEKNLRRSEPGKAGAGAKPLPPKDDRRRVDRQRDGIPITDTAAALQAVPKKDQPAAKALTPTAVEDSLSEPIPDTRQVPLGAGIVRPQQRHSPEHAEAASLGGERSGAIQARDTDVIRDLKRAINSMEEASMVSAESPQSGLDAAPPIALAMDSSEGLDHSSPVSHSAPAVRPLSEGALAGETFQELKNQYAIHEGELRDVSFARILARLHRSRGTGRLLVKVDGIEKSIFFRLGEPIFVDSNKKEELLGHFLLTRKLITQAQLSEALARLNEWGGRLGDALVAIGAIPAHEVFNHLSLQMAEKLLDIFTWDTGYYGYYENQEPNTQGYALDLDTYNTIVEGCRDRISVARIKDFYANRMHVAMYLRQPPTIHIDRLRLRAKELRIYTQLSSGENLTSLLRRFSAEQSELVYRCIYLLHQTEIIAFEVTEKVTLPD